MIDPARILEIVKTKQESIALQKQLDELLNGIFSRKPFEEIAAEELPFDKKERLFELLRYYRIDTKNLVQLQTFLQELKTVLLQVPVVTLTLAFYPQHQLIAAISTWFLAHVKRPFLVDIAVDQEMIGGAAVSYKGIHFDYSLKKVLEDKYTKGELRLQ